MKNLELKAVCGDLAPLRRSLRALGARRQRVLLQTDTYVTVPHGRLKLRERKGARLAELIFYVRPDVRKARTSDYQTLPVADGPGMLRLLRAMFAEDVCVRKRRDLWMYGNTRIHLDSVDGLGTFVEIEVPYKGQGTGDEGRGHRSENRLAQARQTMTRLVRALGIRRADVLDRSYADLLAGRRGEAGGQAAHSSRLRAGD